MDILLDWKYGMRRHMQEIIPSVFLGPFAAAMRTQYDNLLKNGITHVICVRQTAESSFIKPCFPNNFRYLVLNIEDSFTEHIIKHFEEVNSFITSCLNQGGKVLVHGNGGISRSAALVIAYLIESLNISYRDAFRRVQSIRFCISLNENFEAQLMEYELICKARHTVHTNSATPSLGLFKRKWSENEDDTQ